MYHIFPCWQKKKITKKKCITAPILKPNYDQKPETFFFLGGGGRLRLRGTVFLKLALVNLKLALVNLKLALVNLKLALVNLKLALVNLKLELRFHALLVAMMLFP